MSALGSKKIFAPLFVVLVLLVSFLTARSPRKLASASGSSILVVHDDTLTNYRAAATAVQDVSPLAIQRGVNIDGSIRAGSTHPMHLAGNPFGSPWSANQTLNGIRTVTGSYAPTDVDISLPADGPAWVIGRTYNSRQEESSSHHDSDGYQGKNWFQTSQPEIVIYWDTAEGTEDTDDVLYLVYGADRFLEFNRSGTSDEFFGVNGAAGVVEFTAGDDDNPDTYTYYDQWGYQFVFFGFEGFDAGGTNPEGQIWKVVDPGTLVAYVGDPDTGDDAVTLGYDDGRILYAFDSEDRRFSYTYDQSSHRLTEVVAETKTGGDWFGTPTGVTEVASVEYEYYSSEDYGDPGDLRMVEITTPLSDSGLSSTRKKYYRYWDHDSSGYHFDDNPGYPHQVRMILDYEGTRRQDWADEDLTDEDFKTETSSNLESYASVHIEYDSSYRAMSAWFNGACGCGGSANGEHTFEYEDNTSSYSDGTGYDTAWMTRVVVAKPEGSYLTQYFDEAGQSLHQVATDGTPTGSPDRWVTKITRNSDGVVTEISTPANITAYTHAIGSWSISTSTSEGLVRTFVLETTGQTKGFILDRKYQEGTSGSAYFAETVAYDTASMTIATNVDVVRPVVDERRVYTEAITSGTTGSHLTEYTPDWYTGSGEDLILESLETKHPKVVAGNNGSDAHQTSTTYFTKQGRRKWLLKDDGAIDYWEYSGGQLSKYIRDTDTTETGDFDETVPSGLSSDPEAVHRRTTISYDAGGRPTASVGPDGAPVNTARTYMSKLEDERPITLEYAHFDDTPNPDKYYGPVRFTVRNLAGQVEASGVIGLTSDESTSARTAHIDETESDPLLAIDIGTVEQMTTSIFGDSGQQRTESRLYFDVPTSGDGTDGTNYDATFYAYDDEGRQIRIEEPSGTLRRTTYDAMGRVASRLIGINDNGYEGGDTSGTADMVTTQLLVYDGGLDDGNGYLTKRTMRVEDDSDNERVTKHSHDARGNVFLVENPTAPHVYLDRDNLGRVVATGYFSGVSGLTESSDPAQTGTMTNRLALTQTSYDELGRVYKTQRHKIDTVDGSDDDNLVELTWYDESGMVIMVDGEELSKTFYDRLGRMTHHFTLANVDSTEYNSGSYGSYSKAKDLVDDHVLLERQTTYESSGSDDVIMEAVISRHHDDLSDVTGTKGALDTNADDNNVLKYTATNVKGRIQIRSMWYDDEGRGRITTEVNYGTNNAEDFNRAGLTEPTRSADALRTDYTYNTDGSLLSVTGPTDLEIETQYVYDDAGRQVDVIRNYNDGTPPGTPGGPPKLAHATEDLHTRTEYTDGLVTRLWVDWDGDGSVDTGSLPDQVTDFTYGTTKGTFAGDSNIGTGHLLQKVQYPDSSGGSDVVTFAYNGQEQLIYRRDQAGNVIETDYDYSGREVHRRATTIASGFDTEVQRISMGYDGLGRRETISQHSDDDPESGTVKDEVKYTFEGWGYVSKIEQDNNSAVVASGDEYVIDYTYTKRQAIGRNTIRRVNLVAPSGNTFDHEYRSTSNRFDDDCSRVTHIDDGATLLALYAYNGVGQVVGTDYAGVDVKMERFGSTPGTYDSLDRFDRVTSDIWVKDLTTDKAIYNTDVSYDRNGSILDTTDHIHAGFDVQYTIDALDRLTRAEQGTLSGGSISNQTQDQTWTLDQVGNWAHVSLDLDADDNYGGTGEYDDARSHNSVNEITGRDTNSNSPDEHSPTYDSAGNLTDDDDQFVYVYDAFYRLRKVNDQSPALVVEHRYNGLGHRIAEYADGEWHHFCYDERWRVVAMFVDSDTAPTEEFMHHGAGNSGFGGSSYIDEVILRDRDSNDKGSLDERVFYCQNWHGDVVVLTDGGEQVEMVRYSAYGVPFSLPAGDMDSDGIVDGTDDGLAWNSMNGDYEVLGDMDLDGDVDSDDVSFIQGNHTTAYGREVLSGFDNRKSVAGYTYTSLGAFDIRHRHFFPELGIWSQRDPIGYIYESNGVFVGREIHLLAGKEHFYSAASQVYDMALQLSLLKDPRRLAITASLYEYAGSNPERYVDPMGLQYGPFPGGAGGEAPYVPKYKYGKGGNPRRTERPRGQDIRDRVSELGFDSERGPGDAVKHCIAACRYSRKYGTIAYWAMQYRESRSNHGDEGVDSHNNKEGWACSFALGGLFNTEGMSCEECCLRKLVSGALMWGQDTAPTNVPNLAFEVSQTAIFAVFSHSE